MLMERQRRPAKTKVKGLEPSYDVLRKLEVSPHGPCDPSLSLSLSSSRRSLFRAHCAMPHSQVALRTNPSQWAEEFVDHPNNGHLLLMEFIRDLPKAAHAAAKFPILQRAAVRAFLSLCLASRALRSSLAPIYPLQALNYVTTTFLYLLVDFNIYLSVSPRDIPSLWLTAGRAPFVHPVHAGADEARPRLPPHHQRGRAVGPHCPQHPGAWMCGCVCVCLSLCVCVGRGGGGRELLLGSFGFVV
jgi:hypothetical protein